MKEIEPQITIILVTYNRALLLGAMLTSVKNQTYPQWQCLVIDDGSIDNTREIVASHIEKDSRFKYFVRPDTHKKGLPGARNYGLELAKGDFIIFFDDDDVAHPQNLEICVNELLDSDSDFCHYRKKSFTESIPVAEEISRSENYYEIGLNQIEQVVTNKMPLASCTVMWKRECFATNRFNESLSYAEEWECYTRILLEGYTGIGIDEVLYFNRKHAASNTGEFWLGDAGRKASKVEATKVVIENLKQHKLLSKRLIRYFVQMGIFLKEKSIIEYVLLTSQVNFFVRTKYRMLYKFYPIIVVGHRTKKLLKKKLF